MNADRPPTSKASVSIDEQIRAYRDDRRRRRSVQTARWKKECRASEHEVVIGLAQRWLPYGEPPEDEIFQLFGLTRCQYIDLLWTTVDMVDRDGRLTAQFAAVYPKPHGEEGG